MNNFLLLSTVCVLFLLFPLVLVSASRAPDVAPLLPEGWCNLKYGTPTRTTGECICKRECKGRKCVRSQGFIFYAYKDCPDCECVDKEKVSDEDLQAQRAHRKLQQDVRANAILDQQQQQQEYGEDSSSSSSSSHTWFDEFFFWFEDYGSYYAIGLVSFALCLALALLIVIMHLPPQTPPATPTPATPAPSASPTSNNSKND